MPKSVSTKELRNMSPEDLRREIAGKRMNLAKIGMHVRQRSEKDTAKLRRERREMARLLTILHEVELLKNKPKKAKVPASAKATAGKPASTLSA